MEEKGRIIGLLIALAVCILIMIATKSCIDSATEARREARANATQPTNDVHLITEPYTQPNTGDDLLIDGEVPHLIEDETVTTERQYETVTNILGNVVETIPITSPEEANMPTTTLSILDAYRKNSQKETTLPDETEAPTTHEYVEPNTDFTIVIN